MPSTPSQSVVHALGVDTDGSGTVLAGDKQRLLIEIVDPGQRWGPLSHLQAHALMLLSRLREPV